MGGPSPSERRPEVPAETPVVTPPERGKKAHGKGVFFTEEERAAIQQDAKRAARRKVG